MILITKPITTPSPRRRVKRPRELERKRGNGAIFDIIDEWISPLLAQMIALQTQDNHLDAEK